jgi:hypothetical protein
MNVLEKYLYLPGKLFLERGSDFSGTRSGLI